MNPQQEILLDTREKLNEVSPSFCIAKWTQSTLHLHRGLTHSCHHPKTHKIPLSEIDQSNFALHNTEEKILRRKEMIEGKRPEECSYCWNIEDLGSDHFSDRVLKSKDPWALPFLEEIKKDPLNKKIFPRYLEIAFSRGCNFRCMYCSPSFSSRWAQEIKMFGPYETRAYEQQPHHLEDAFEEENNPYIAAFWKWWPELKKELHTLRITGGEPLLSENTFRLIDELISNPEPNLEFSINTNLSATSEKMERFQKKVKELMAAGAVKKFQIYTSIEALGVQAEYIRNGLNEKVLWRNLENYLNQHPSLTATIMVTYNFFSATTFLDFLKKVLGMRKKFSAADEPARIKLDISYLRHPFFLAPNLIPESMLPLLDEQLKFLEENRAAAPNNRQGFYNFEVVKMSRLVDWAKSNRKELELKKYRRELVHFIRQHDERREVNFAEGFPEYSPHFSDWEARDS